MQIGFGEGCGYFLGCFVPAIEKDLGVGTPPRQPQESDHLIIMIMYIVERVLSA